MKTGHGEADFLLFFDGSPIGVVEAKREGETLTGIEFQTTISRRVSLGRSFVCMSGS
jgi:type I restriction enzyme R subunit